MYEYGFNPTYHTSPLNIQDERCVISVISLDIYKEKKIRILKSSNNNKLHYLTLKESITTPSQINLSNLSKKIYVFLCDF
uniref:Uncharacterized protein n=1 Tax=viral metagenome TaxID=1070528 RepID=A0A6C0AFE8_9ZZZZ